MTQCMAGTPCCMQALCVCVAPRCRDTLRATAPAAGAEGHGLALRPCSRACSRAGGGQPWPLRFSHPERMLRGRQTTARVQPPPARRQRLSSWLRLWQRSLWLCSTSGPDRSCLRAGRTPSLHPSQIMRANVLPRCGTACHAPWGPQADVMGLAGHGAPWPASWCEATRLGRRQLAWSVG